MPDSRIFLTPKDIFPDSSLDDGSVIIGLEDKQHNIENLYTGIYYVLPDLDDEESFVEDIILDSRGKVWNEYE
jgi:hypothetical protein